MASKCPKCQADNPETAKFCADCGTQLTPSDEASPYITKTIETRTTRLAIGSLFAKRYEILEELGRGGMGEVYKVKDQKIDEEMALKVIRPEIAASHEIIERFKNELKFARKIAHKHVCKMYDLNEEEEIPYITMEYVRGEDLRSIIKEKKRLSEKDAIKITRQVCEGLAGAHELGVIHRDLKPQNIMIDENGNAKVMDFGIARSIEAQGVTHTGVMIGTPDYISPEQAEGEEADQRSDIYSLGVILYEMVTGRVPFEGGTALSIALKHKARLPRDPRKLNPGISENLSRLILICMEKARESRYQTAEALLNDLENIKEGLPLGTKIKPRRATFTQTLIRKKFLISASVLIVLAVVIILSIFLINILSTKEPVLPIYRQLTFTGNAKYPTISPDGNFLAYMTEGKVWVLDMATGHSIEIFDAEAIYNTLWTPEGSQITIWAKRDGKVRTYLVSRLGGQPQRISDGRVLAWSPDGSRFADLKLEDNRQEIIIVDRSSGDSISLNLGEPIWICDDIDWSPSGDRLLLNIRKKENLSTIWTIKLNGIQKNKVVECWPLWSPTWSPNGDAIYYGHEKEKGQSGIWKIPISQKTGKATKPSSLILPNKELGHFSFTDDGKLLYARVTNYSNLWLAKIEERGNGRTVKTQKLTKGTFLHSTPNISPNKKAVAYSRGNGETTNIYVMPIEGGNPWQLTFFNSDNSNPVWSPDGEEIAFGSNEGGEYSVWKVNAKEGSPYKFGGTDLASGYGILWEPNPNIIYRKRGFQNYYILNPKTEEQTPLLKVEPNGYCFNTCLSPDGKRIAFQASRKALDIKKTFYDIWSVNLVDYTQKLLIERETPIYPIGWSQDGNWIYFFGIEKGQRIYMMIEVESGKTRPLPILPFRIEGETYNKLIDDNPEIYVVGKTQSDVWVIENFDKIIQ